MSETVAKVLQTHPVHDPGRPGDESQGLGEEGVQSYSQDEGRADERSTAEGALNLL